MCLLFTVYMHCGTIAFPFKEKQLSASLDWGAFLFKGISFYLSISDMCQYTGCPKKRTFRMLLEPQVAGSPCVWKLIFWSFLTKTKPDQAFPSHVYGKILHHSNQFWLWFCSISTFFWDTLYSFATFIPQPQAHRI